MKKISVVFLVSFFLFSFSTSVNAEDIKINDIYSQQYESSGADKLQEGLPDDVAEKMKDLDISTFDTDWLNDFTPKNIFQSTFDFLKTGGKRPLIALSMIIAVLLLSAVVGGINTDNKTVIFVTVMCVTASAILPAVGVVKASISAVSSVGAFMLSFIPVFAGILISQGKALTATGFSSVMLAVSEAISVLCSYVVMPLTGIQLGLAISGAVLSEMNISSIGKTLKKVSVWVLSLSSTVLLGILSIQTLVSTSADNITVKTTKFIIGTAVPIVGSTVSEALTTVNGCIKMLSSSVAVYGVIAVALIFLPTVIELLLWRLALSVSAMLAEMLGQQKSAELLHSVDSAISFILGVLILSGVLFIISITVVAVL